MNNSSSDVAALLARCEALQREQAELARLALIGQAFIGLAHELNNALNSMMLQASVLQLRVDEQGRQELAAIRQQGAQAAGLVRMLQQVVQERHEESYAVDLNSVIAEILEEEAELRRCVTPRLSQKAPHIHSTRGAVKQLIHLLLKGACAGKEATVKAATGEQDGNAVLSLTIAGAEGDVAVESLLWRDLDEIGRLAGPSLLRQLGGILTAERTGDGSVDLRISWTRTA